ncbi:MAG: hypothetical protein Q4F41_08720 [Eubacteriales bacterium]|nr:hypothetical protein [Eubacteriales bacterium]
MRILRNKDWPEGRGFCGGCGLAPGRKAAGGMWFLRRDLGPGRKPVSVGMEKAAFGWYAGKRIDG